MDHYNYQTDFLKTAVNQKLLILAALLALLYFFLLAFWFPKGYAPLFYLLIFGEVFHLWQVLGYIHTVWDTKPEPAPTSVPDLAVDVFITVAGEPVEIVRETALAALAMRHNKTKIYLLNDGYAAKKENWHDVIILARELDIGCLTRKTNLGAKAGNINYALSKTKAPLVAIFDADQAPHADFLEKMLPYFADKQLGFVQSPQYYKNFSRNEITKGAWEQQELFYGPICKGKNRLNAVFMCGTNTVIRRQALADVGGMCETNIAEDFLTSLSMHKKGWKSLYLPEVLAEGLAPEDFLSYYKQQFRWARGSLEVVFKHNPLFQKNLSRGQKIQYLLSSSYYLSGPIVLMNALLPIIFFFTGKVPITVSTMSLAAIFLPYIFLNILILRLSSNSSYTFEALSFSMSSFSLQLQALWAMLTNKKNGFEVTSKQQLKGNFLYLVWPHLLYFVLLTTGLGVAVVREGFDAAVVTNLSWALFNAAVFYPFIIAASPLGSKSQTFKSEYQPSQALAMAPANYQLATSLTGEKGSSKVMISVNSHL